MDSDWFQWITEGVLISVIGSIGLLGNIISVAIFGRQRVQRLFHRLLLTLAAFDTVNDRFPAELIFGSFFHAKSGIRTFP